MKIRFAEEKIRNYDARFSYAQSDEALFALRSPVERTGYLTKAQLRTIARWKSPRSAKHIEGNSETFIREVTHFALHARDERSRIEPLTLLNGVLWPTASVILHFFHQSRYPILDVRALWSLGMRVPGQYTFDFWLQYVKYCRTIAGRNGVTMRELDRALWQYSSEHQP